MNKTCAVFKILLLLGVVVLAGCGAGTGNGTIFSSPGTTLMQVNVSDSPADQVLAAQVTFTAINLLTPSSSVVRVLPGTTVVEISHLQATAQPISHFNVPQGSYTGVMVTLGNVVVTFVNTSNGQIQNQIFAGPFSVPVNTPFTVGLNPVALNLDLNLAASIQTFANGGFTPSMAAVLNNVPAFNQQEEGNGGVHGLLGLVIGAPGTSSFVLGANQLSMSLTVDVDANTQFVGVSGLSGLTAGSIVLVNAVLQNNGALLATKVETEPGAKQAVEGVVVSRTPGNPNNFQVVVQNQAGTNAPLTGSVLTVLSDNSTSYTFAADEANLAGLPFTPAFAGFGNLVVGQRVKVDTTSDFTAIASQVRLEPQTQRGQVAQNGSQFSLTLPFDSALDVLNGTTSVDFFVQPNTELQGLTSIVPGNQVHVRGLLFFDVPSGNYELVASRITP